MGSCFAGEDAQGDPDQKIQLTAVDHPQDVNCSEILCGQHSEHQAQHVFGDQELHIHLVGIALDQGKLEGVEQRVFDLLPGKNFANNDARNRR